MIICKIFWNILTFFVIIVAAGTQLQAQTHSDPIRVGWIGSLTGPALKYGSHNAAMLAEEVINARGGINGRKLQLVYEDARCEGKFAVGSLMKELNVDNLRLIVGGHCSPESSAMAPIAEKYGAVLLAATSSSPKLTGVSDNFFVLLL